MSFLFNQGMDNGYTAFNISRINHLILLRFCPIITGRTASISER